MRIALFGGSFDPPHRGHIGIAEAAVDRLQLDQVLMAPVGCQPLKRNQAHSPYEDRLAMVRLACAGHPRLEASEIDAPPVGDSATGTLKDTPNYTYDTLQRLRSFLSPRDTLFCLIGADSLLTLHHWYRAAEAMFLAQWIVAARPGFDLQSLGSLLPPGIESGALKEVATLKKEDTARTRVPIRASGNGIAAHGELWLLQGLHYEVAATELRKALADQSRGISQRVLDPRVAEYARAHGLYEFDEANRFHGRGKASPV